MFKNYIFPLLTGVLWLFFSLNVEAQSEKDNQLWQGIALEYKVNKQFSLNLSDQVRLDQDISKFQLNLIQLEGTYKLTPLFRMAGGYRFSLMPLINRHRLYAEPILRYEWKEKDLKIWLRTKLQYEFDKKQNNTAHIRPMIFVKYEPYFPDRIEPFIATELFYRVNPDATPDQFRIYTGLDYKLTKEITFRVAYTRSHELNAEAPLRANIFFAQVQIEVK